MGRWHAARECQKLGSQFFRKRLWDLEDAKQACQIHAKRVKNKNMVDRKWPYLDIPCLSTESGWRLVRSSAKTNEGDSHCVHTETEWKAAQPHLETANCTALSASPPNNTTMSSISNYFRIKEMCPRSAPLVKVQKAFWTGQEQMVQAGWHSNTCTTQARQGEKIPFSARSSGTEYQTLERIWIAARHCSKSKHCILPPSIRYSSLSILLSPWDYQLQTDTLDGFWDLGFHYSATTLTNYKSFAKYLMFSLAESPCLMGW